MNAKSSHSNLTAHMTAMGQKLLRGQVSIGRNRRGLIRIDAEEI